MYDGDRRDSSDVNLREPMLGPRAFLFLVKVKVLAETSLIVFQLCRAIRSGTIFPVLLRQFESNGSFA